MQFFLPIFAILPLMCFNNKLLLNNMNVKGITTDQLDRFLQELGITPGVDSEGDRFVLFSADENFDHDVVVYIMIRNNDSLGFYGFANNYMVADTRLVDAMIAINNYGAENKFPKVYIRDRTIVAEQWFMLDETVSEEYIKENCIKTMLSVIWQFFCDFRY